MNFKALLLGLLLLLPVGLLAMPRGNATQHVVPSLFVTPSDTKFYGPCLVSTNFQIDVILWNNPLSGLDVYAFDFDISWAGITTISLVSATAHSPWANFFIIANTNTTTPATDWHLAITATPPSTGLFSVNQSVLTLVFHIDTDVCWPNNMVGSFNLVLNSMSGDGTKPVPITTAEIDGGTFEQYSVQPNIELTSTAANATGWIIEKCVSHTFDVEVDLTNVTNVYGFDFYLTYDPAHLETDPQHITFKAAFPPPYETLQVTFPVAGEIYIQLVRPSEKPTVCGADVPAVDVVFHTIDTADGAGVIPTTSISAISIPSADIYYKCPGALVYSYPGVILYGGDLTYYFKPSMYDLNLDCVVDVQDLQTLLPYYGTITPVGGYGYLSNIVPPSTNGLVDIFDFVAIAKNFGPVDP